MANPLDILFHYCVPDLIPTTSFSSELGACRGRPTRISIRDLSQNNALCTFSHVGLCSFAKHLKYPSQSSFGELDQNRPEVLSCPRWNPLNKYRSLVLSPINPRLLQTHVFPHSTSARLYISTIHPLCTFPLANSVSFPYGLHLFLHHAYWLGVFTLCAGAPPTFLAVTLSDPLMHYCISPYSFACMNPTA